MYNKIGKLSSTIITFFIVVVGWVFFRVEKISDAFAYLKRMFACDFNGTMSFSSEFYTFLAIAAFFAFFAYFNRGQKIQDAVYFNYYNIKKHFAAFAISVLLLVLCISSITTFGFNPFIYFRF